MYSQEVCRPTADGDQSPARRPFHHCAMHVSLSLFAGEQERFIGDCGYPANSTFLVAVFLLVALCCAMPPHYFVLKKILKRSEPMYKPPTARCWIGSWVNPSMENMTDVLIFNEPGGPVPNDHAIAYIIIAGERLGEHLNNPSVHTTMYFYFELKDTAVTAEQLRLWFPSCQFEPNQSTAEETKERLRNIGLYIEHTFTGPF